MIYCLIWYDYRVSARQLIQRINTKQEWVRANTRANVVF